MLKQMNQNLWGGAWGAVFKEGALVELLIGLYSLTLPPHFQLLLRLSQSGIHLLHSMKWGQQE